MEDFKISLLWVRDQPVILDYHLAALYEVKTKRLNEQVRRNRFRFPEDFVFRLTPIEWEKVVANRDHLCKPFYANILPMAFTEQGALMASTVLHSSKAIQMSIYIVRAFVKMRMEMSANEIILRKLAEIDRTLLMHDDGLRDLYEKLMPLLEPNGEPKKRKIGFGEERF